MLRGIGGFFHFGGALSALAAVLMAVLMAVLAGVAVAAPALASAASLRMAAEQFAGVPVRLDERLPAPDCAGGYQFRWGSGAADQLEAFCPATGWRLRIPVAAQQAVGPRRGEVLRVEIEGEGYRVGADAVVESVNPRDGTLLLKNVKSGARFTGHLREDGTVVAGRAQQ